MGRHIKTEADLSANEKICLNSFFVNAETLDSAYLLCHQNCTANAKYRHELALRWVRRGTPQRAYIDGLNKRIIIVGKLSPDGSKDKSPESEYIDFSIKSNVIEALSKAANEEVDGLKRAKILSEISDLMRMDKDENKDEQELTHFYLPLSCKRCSLYCQEQEKRKQIFKV
jgi:hypothetical protein